MKARYVVLEGIQGSGKTDQIFLLVNLLRSKGIAVHQTKEPGGADAAARAIRLITQTPEYNLTTKTEVLLYNAARAQLLGLIRDQLKKDVWVVCDRSYLTTLAIQYYARNDIKNYSEVEQICKFAVGGTEPDLTIVLDVPAKVAQKRAEARYRGERFDQLELDFLKRMRQGYLKEAKKRGHPVIDGTQTIATVAKAIERHIVKFLT